MTTTIVVDCMGANLVAVLAHLTSPTQMAGYTTGGGGVTWSSAQLDRSPSPIRICQDAGATDYAADVLDVESGAATIADIATWLPRARANFKAGTRPGQRNPAIYCSESNLTNVANELVSIHETDVPIWEADYSFSQAQATTAVTSASGPFPIVGFQFDGDVINLYDVSVFSAAWLSTVSSKPAPAPKPAPIPVAPFAALSAKAVYTISLDRTIKGYKGEYSSQVYDAAGKQVATSNNSTDAAVTFTVSAPGTYSVHTGATGYSTGIKSVVVG
jgi:hypothetical protein